MISFGPSDEQNLVVETLKSFAADVLRPAARAADESEKLPEDVLQQAWELGFAATQLPEAYGGAGEARSPITSALALEALATGDAALAVAITHPAASSANPGVARYMKRVAVCVNTKICGTMASTIHTTPILPTFGPKPSITVAKASSTIEAIRCGGSMKNGGSRPIGYSKRPA